MRVHRLVAFSAQLLVALFTHITLASARLSGHHGRVRPHPSFVFNGGVKHPPASTSITSLASAAPALGTSATSTQSQTLEKALQDSSNNVASSSIGASSALPSVDLSHSATQLDDSSSATSHSPTISLDAAVESTSSPPTSPLPSVSAEATRSKKLIETLVPIIIAALVVCAIPIAFFRHRRSQDKKAWEGSHLPDMDVKPGIWPFRRFRTAPEKRPRSAYLGGGDGNRSDAYLRGEEDYHEKHGEHSTNGTRDAMESHTTPISVAQDHAPYAVHSEIGHEPPLESAHWESEQDYVQTFHSDCPMHDEPALPSRPGTSLDPLPSYAV
ncbi:hypothetical protein C8R45DRAFT_318126 [Mycena sanguinolenta]|nr:hypothetical protein C8R45DRAFT_318126 [Mycena sanguinolenta]